MEQSLITVSPRQQHPLSVAYKPISVLCSHPQNARTHSKHQIRQIAESIRVFGFTNPVLVDGKNRIIAGHGRVEAAKSLGIALVFRLYDLATLITWLVIQADLGNEAEAAISAEWAMIRLQKSGKATGL
jgi:ParB-like chromosome segregation protein Spo0J